MVARLVVDYVFGAEAYGAAVRPHIAQHDGGYRAAQREPEVLEGDPRPWGVALIELPSVERLRAFWHSPECAAVERLRAGTATLVVRAVEGR